MPSQNTDPTALPKAETFAAALEVLRDIQPDWCDERVNDRIDDVAARLEDAHAREMAARDERIRELEAEVEQLEAQNFDGRG